MMPKDRIENMTATLLWKDIPVLDFEVRNGKEIFMRAYLENRKYYPVEFQHIEVPTLDALNAFIDVRIIPRTRQNLSKTLERLGLSEYSWDKILRVNHGLCSDDCYWLRMADESLTYKDVKIRD